MVFTRVQLDIISKKLVEELMKCSNIADHSKTHKEGFDGFVSKKLKFFISQSFHKPRKRHFELCSIHKKKNAGNKSCSLLNKQYQP